MVPPGVLLLRYAGTGREVAVDQDPGLAAFDAFALVRSVRPDVVISTGAAPGAFALFFGKLFGAKTIWIDGIASTSKLSMSGKITRLVQRVTESS